MILTTQITINKHNITLVSLFNASVLRAIFLPESGWHNVDPDSSSNVEQDILIIL